MTSLLLGVRRHTGLTRPKHQIAMTCQN